MARNTKADANTLRSVSSPGMQSKKGNVNRKGRSVTGGAAMSGMNIRGAGGLGKSKPKNVEVVVKKYKKQVSSDRKAAAKERAGMRAKGIKYEELKSFSGFLDEASNPEGKSAAAKTFSKKKTPTPSDRIQTRQHTGVSLSSEEAYDHIRDRRLEKYGTGHDGSDRKGSTRYHSRPDTPEQKKRKQAASDQAYKSVVDKLKKRYGDGVMTSSRKIRNGKEVK